MTKRETKLIPMVQFILEIDWMNTKEFCNKYSVPLPRFTGDIQTSADKFLQIDAIKHKMFVEHAKLLNKEINTDILVKNLGFEILPVRGNPQYKNGKYTVSNDQYGFYLEPYDSIDGERLDKLSDLTSYGFTYTS